MELKPSGTKHYVFCRGLNRTLWNWNMVEIGLNCWNTCLNRTLWNWNIMSPFMVFTSVFVLIVLYGIETIVCKSVLVHLVSCLNRTLWNWNKNLCAKDWFLISLNRTLWNWNCLIYHLFHLHKSLNRTLWNWNFTTIVVGILGGSLNRTLWNWN